MEVVSSSHSCLAFHRTPLSAWRFRGNGLGPGHSQSARPIKSAVLCVGTGRASNPGDSGKVHVSHGFYVSDVDAALQGIPKKAGEIEKVMIPGLPEEPDSSQISTGFWEWKPKLTVYYEKSGTENSKAPAVLFLPGFGVGTFHFEKQLRDLGRDYKVWTMDFLGQGMSLPCEDPAPKDILGEKDGEAFWGFGQDLQPWAEELVYSVDLWRKHPHLSHQLSYAQFLKCLSSSVLLFYSLLCHAMLIFAKMSFEFSSQILVCFALLEGPAIIIEFSYFLYQEMLGRKVFQHLYIGLYRIYRTMLLLSWHSCSTSARFGQMHL